VDLCHQNWDLRYGASSREDLIYLIWVCLKSGLVRGNMKIDLAFYPSFHHQAANWLDLTGEINTNRIT
jgi:hypothetical protein